MIDVSTPSPGSKNSLLHSLAIQGRVIGALLMREVLTRYGRHNVGFLWVFLEPMLFTSGVTALWTLTKAVHGTNLPITAFAVTGYSSVLMWRNTANRCALAITPNLGLLFHRNVRVIDVFLARIFLEIAGITASAAVISITFISLGLMELPADMGLVLLGWFYLAWFGVALGLAVGGLSERSDTAERLWHTVAYLMFPLSGAVFMVDWLPQAAQRYVLLIPTVHGVEMFRGGFFGAEVKTHYSVAYITVACLIVTLIGLVLVRDVGNKVEFE
jgi:capsular polysaccharide transport system permease protein